MTKVAVYIDGFNLYNGLRSKHGRKYLWLDLGTVATRLLKSDQELVGVRYFTASVRDDPAAQRRERMFLGALRTMTSVDIVLGRFQEKESICPRCRSCRLS